MNAKKLYEAHYADYCIFTGGSSKYEWAASEIFDLVTYDGSLDELFVKKIIDVIKTILNRTTYEYIKDETNYITFIIVCQILDKFHWITWGTSIRGAWFESGNGKQILERNLMVDDHYGLPFSINNLEALIEFIESEVSE